MEDTIIVKFKGGLGNQMFQYALYYKLKQLGKNVKGDISHYTLYKNSMPFSLNKAFPEISLQYATQEEIDYYLNKQKVRSLWDKVEGKVLAKKRYYTSEKEEGMFESGKRLFRWILADRSIFSRITGSSFKPISI